MTRPGLISFGYDDDLNRSSAKIYLRFLIYSTSRRGRAVENMYVRLRSPKRLQTFPLWAHGEKHLSMGSGLFVGLEGVARHHHFLLSKGASDFLFEEGKHTVEVVVGLVGDKHERSLGRWSVSISKEAENVLSKEAARIYFHWEGDAAGYVSSVEKEPRASASKAPGLESTILALLKSEREGKTT